MNPFAQPYTAPDGTTRRPLAERVPECVPTHDGRRLGQNGTGTLNLWFSINETWQVGIVECASEQAIAALWRVSVSEWAKRYTGSYNEGSHNPAFYVVEAIVEGDAKLLNSACHQIADSMVVEK